MGTPKMIKKVGEIVKDTSKKGHLAVVVSAFQGITDELLSFSHSQERWNENLLKLKKRHLDAVNKLMKIKRDKRQVIEYVENFFRELENFLKKVSKWTPEHLDYLASFGERLSAFIVAASMKNAYFVDARELVKTDNNFTNAAVDFNKTNRRIKNYFRNRRGIPIITGFLGSTDNGETTTLGRGGSDYTAAILGAALGVKVVEIWTDVDGVMSVDPRLVKSAQVLPKISYEEAVEMAYFGAKVIHPATMLPAIKKDISILIKNTFNPKAPGTLIQKGLVPQPMAKGITSIDDIVLVNVGGVSLSGIPGSAARVFEATARAKVNVILISQASSEYTICFAIKSNELPAAFSSLKKEFSKETESNQVTLSAIPGQCILALVGDGMRGVPGISGELFKILGDNGVNITAIAQGGSERNISFVVDSVNKIKALNVVHDKFFNDGVKNIFLVGTGNIGGTLLNQIYNLLRSDFNKLRVCGIVDAFHMLMDERGINLSGWQRRLERGGGQDFEKWLDWAKSLPLGNKIFVDCTASDDVAKKYIEIAEAGFHIVTPNKKFNTRSMKEYIKLREIMKNNKKQFLYETNVGAGLPLISTIRDLLLSGDKVMKIEGVFSGTLSYLFNNFDGTRPFSRIVSEAKELGYTEPDPREDLNGNDVGRKLLVLAREIGWPLEFKDVKIENLAPQSLLSHRIAPKEFLERLKEFDGHFKKLLEKARLKNKVLRYVAKLEKGKAIASLQAVALDNPLASTRGADNIFAIYTKRYNKRPLVVQGPGAGAEVTAGGVLADILRI